VLNCKKCGKEFSYSDLSQKKVEDQGHSLPLYCEKHRAENKKHRSTMGVSYFKVRLKEGERLSDIKPGPLGMLSHPNNDRRAVITESGFDKNKYGMTTKEMVIISEWFKDPKHQVVVVEGPTGSGKSTALVHWLLYPPKGLPQKQYTSKGQIQVTQPRIVAAKGIAKHVGETLFGSGVGKGHDIGFSYSGDKNTDWRNSVVYLTDGTLLNVIQRGALDNISVIMVDEAHERSLNIDLILRLLKDVLPLYPNLKLIIASATINAKMFRDYYGKHTAKVVTLGEKSVFGYVVNYNTGRELPFDEPQKLKEMVKPILVSKIKSLVSQMMSKEIKTGDVLGFLNGVRQIDEAVQELKAWVKENPSFKKKVEVYPLYSKLPDNEQKFVRETNNDPNLIRIIVSTNVAEASVTVDGVVYVVDSGVEYQSFWDAEKRTTELRNVVVSRANAKQRWGRCGRNKPGVVFCLYTEDQFNSDAFLEYPIPQIKRSNLEPVVIAAKASGVENIFEGWLQDPPKEESKRAIDVMKSKGVLSKEEYLTPYGSLVRYFSYPIEIADLIMLSDRLGCVVEMATLLPIIKNGGRKYIFKWDKEWSRYKKQKVAKVHRELMRGCKDDVEFILKVCKAWEDLPWITFQNKKKISEEKWNKLQVEWAERNYLDVDSLLETFGKERSDVLDKLFVKRKSKGYRPINLDLMDKVRFLLLRAFPDQLANSIRRLDIDNYEFEVFLEQLDNSSITTSVFITDKVEEVLKESLKDNNIIETALTASKINMSNSKTFRGSNRLYANQAFPLDSTLLCKPKESDTPFKIGDRAPVSILKVLSLAKMEQINQEKGKKKKGKKKIQKKKGPTLLGKDVVGRSLKAYLLVTERSKNAYANGQNLKLIVKGYDYSKPNSPAILLELESQNTTLIDLQNLYTIESEIEVEVVGMSTYPLEFRQHLVVKELETGHEMLMDSRELSFSYADAALDYIPVGTRFRVIVTEINSKKKYVRVSALPYHQERLDDFLEENCSGKFSSAEGKVVLIRNDAKIAILLNLSVPEEGFLVTVTASEQDLQKPAEEFVVGEVCVVRYSPYFQKPFFSRLGQVPDKVKSQVQDFHGKEVPYLDLKESTLYYEGRMSDEEFFNLQHIDKDPSYKEAVRMLYTRSNRLWVENVRNEEEFREKVDGLNEKYPVDTICQARVIKAISSGLLVEIEEGVNGLVYIREMYGKYDKTAEIYAEDSQVNVKVLGYDETGDKFKLSMKIPEYDPITKYPEGEIFEGTVLRTEKSGAFLELEPRIMGRVHVSKMYGFIEHTKDVLNVGEKIQVEVLEYGEDFGQFNLSMLIPAYDPMKDISEGDSFRGVVQNVEYWGAFIEIAPNVTGLLHRSSVLYHPSDSMVDYYTPGEEVSVYIYDINTNEDKTEIDLRTN